MTKTPIYISSVLLEKNRWSTRVPSLKVSDWSRRLFDAGFDGIELWENHLLLVEAAERDAVLAGPLPVTVLNTYCAFDDAGAESRAASAKLAGFLSAPAVKFNLGDDPALAQVHIDNLTAWRELLPADCRLLCECHPGTILEEPERAAKILAPLQDIEIIVHAFSGDDDTVLQRWLEAFGPAVTHIHGVLKDRSHVPGRIDILRSAGFSGTCSIEFCEGVAQPPEDMSRLLATAADDLHYLRKELA
jgi:hypothetical protein